MTTSLKIQIVKRPTVKARMLPRFPATVNVDEFLTLAIANGIYTFGVDYTKLDPNAIIDPSATLMAIYDANSKSYKSASISSLLSQAGQIVQDITAAGPVTITNNAGIVLVEQAAGAPIMLNLPPAANKTCPVLIADWKGDAGTNNITIVPNGAEKIQGKAQWTIAADTGSIFLRPVAGKGYVI